MHFLDAHYIEGLSWENGDHWIKITDFRAIFSNKPIKKHPVCKTKINETSSDYQLPRFIYPHLHFYIFIGTQNKMKMQCPRI